MVDELSRDARHKSRQQRLKQQVDARIAAAQDERGLLVVITGDGKGKSTTGFAGETQDRQAVRLAAQQVWQEAKRLLADPRVDLLLLDELTYMVAFDYLDLDEVLTALVQRPASQHVIITGRGCHRVLLELADTVSEVKNVKHAFDAGIKAQKGIDW